MRRWLLDLFRYSIVWFLLVLFFSIITLTPFIIFNEGDTEILKDYSNPNFLLVFQIPILLATIFLGKTITQRKINSFLSFKPRQIILGFVIGAVLISIFVIHQLILKTTVFSWEGLTISLLISCLMYILVAVNEELLFRQFLFSHLKKKLKIEYAIIIGSLIFGLTHIGNDNLSGLGFVNISLFGVLMSLLYLKYKNVSVPIGAHFSWNFFQGPIFGYEVSGHKGNSLLKADIGNFNHYLNGGNFGAEGSVLLIPIIAITIYLVWKFDILNQDDYSEEKNLK